MTSKLSVIVQAFALGCFFISSACAEGGKEKAAWVLTSSDNYSVPETVVGVWDKKMQKGFYFSSGIRKDFGGFYEVIGYLPATDKAQVLVVQTVNGDRDRTCNANWFLFDLTRPENPFTPGVLKDLCFDTVTQFGPEFYREGDIYVVHFSSSISDRGERQPNVKYVYDRKTGELIAEIKDTKTKRITHRVVQPAR